ncbi:1-deoxy-D-xylulose-5-phosphate synthase [uncultured Duncaniella sp.]|uniref:1-deoxy-D-xylulose-5-phosphate synthase n=1 Tax=uncultured Duncaniella sp. TaxID=2768039 RepID=UPI00261566FE|nr:1-deoxy-D-xylulose-5-phosphate synthase [uncultured Duncaniella sp.]
MKKEKTNVDATTPLLDTIDSPADLRKLPAERLPQVCAELRSFLINSLSSHPGHFASSMGAVELTVALHYVFNTPYDRIVWDVGHQAYCHKLLTGRRDAFSTNRTLGGLSGFPSPKESEYDTFTAGHASNSISAGLGMAVAASVHKDEPHRNVVAVIGDASISGGLAFEGLNNAANSNSDLLIILNDNDMSIDRNVGSLNSYLAHLTSSKGYNDLRYSLAGILRKYNLITDIGKGRITRFNNSLKSLINHEQNIFEGLNIRYFGPFDGNDVATVVKVLNDIKDFKGPRILHLRTTKGKGFLPAEKDPATWHAPGIFDPATGERPQESPEKPPKYQDIFGSTLVEIADSHPEVVGITAAMPSGTSMNKLAEKYPERTFDVGISEGHAVTFSGGLAKDGLKPFVAIYSSFLQRAYSHIIHDVAIEGLPVTFCIDRAGLVGEDGPTHHGVFDLAYLRSIPGMTIAAPRNGDELRRLMHTSLTLAGPIAIRYPRGRAKNKLSGTIEHVTIGKGVRIKDGNDLAILTIGTVADDTTDAIKQAEHDTGKSIAHYDMRFVKPLDSDILTEVARKRCPIITIEDGTVNGGMGSAVLEWLADYFNSSEREETAMPRLIRMGVPDRFIPQGTPDQLHHLCGFDAEGIYKTIKSILK